MAEGKIKASKVKVHPAPEGTGGLDGHFHVVRGHELLRD